MTDCKSLSVPTASAWITPSISKRRTSNPDGNVGSPSGAKHEKPRVDDRAACERLRKVDREALHRGKRALPHDELGMLGRAALQPLDRGESFRLPGGDALEAVRQRRGRRLGKRCSPMLARRPVSVVAQRMLGVALQKRAQIGQCLGQTDRGSRLELGCVRRREGFQHERCIVACDENFEPARELRTNHPTRPSRGKRARRNSSPRSRSKSSADKARKMNAAAGSSVARR